jgi:hypothetical protein
LFCTWIIQQTASVGKYFFSRKLKISIGNPRRMWYDKENGSPSGKILRLPAAACPAPTII